MWIIVCFEEENCVEVVPDYWYKNGHCAWPKKSIKNYKKYIDRRIKPNEIDFDYFKARAMSRNIVNLHDARSKLKIAEETSELSTFENEKSTRSERHRLPEYSYNIKKTKLPNNSRNHNDSPGIIEDPPLLNISDDMIHCNEENVASDYDDSDADKSYIPDNNQKNLYSGDIDDDIILNSPSGKWNVTKMDNTNTMITAGTSKKRLDFINTPTSSTSSPSLNKPSYYSPSIRKLKKASSNSPSDFGIITNEMKEGENNKSVLFSPKKNYNKFKSDGNFKSHLPSIKGGDNSVNMNSNSQTGNNYSTLIDVVNQLVRSTGNLKYEIRELSKKIDSSEKTIMDIVENFQSVPHSHSVDNNFIEEVYNFPLTTIEELNFFEEKLSSDNIFCKKMISELARLERSTISETTRQIMSKIFHDNLLAQFSYQGQKKKRVFSILKTCSIIFSAVRSIRKYNNCPEIDVLKPMKVYMANAKSREDGKQKKNFDNQALQSSPLLCND
uniref:DUF4806 domain-containing protein n=1 Tax=Schizaphis graminum TaxID=13262 RepID=A0A2S2NZ02_SCHGA